MYYDLSPESMYPFDSNQTTKTLLQHLDSFYINYTIFTSYTV